VGCVPSKGKGKIMMLRKVATCALPGAILDACRAVHAVLRKVATGGCGLLMGHLVPL
jgi:hypothetical protein